MFRKLVLAGALAATPTLVAHAADLSGPRVVTAAPIAATWSGFYVGAHVGGQSTTGNFAARIDGPFTNGSFAGMQRSTVAWGALAGYNFQMRELVLGVEADIAAGGSSTAVDNMISSAFNGVAGPTQRHGIDWSARLRARAGIALGGFMPFIAAGYAIGSERFFSMRAQPTPLLADRTRTVGGFSLGAGFEVMVTPNIILRAEYIRDDFGGRSAFRGTNPAFPGVTISTMPTMDSYRAAIAYKF
jgi:outer membrane immunogenic protein